MNIQEASGYCGRCNQKVIVQRTMPNHLFHLILSVFTLGLWLIVWLFARPGAWVCSRCGSLASRSWGDSLGLKRPTVKIRMDDDNLGVKKQ